MFKMFKFNKFRFELCRHSKKLNLEKNFTLQNKINDERWEIVDEPLPPGCYHETEVEAIKAIMSAIIHLSCISPAGVRTACLLSNVVTAINTTHFKTLYDCLYYAVSSVISALATA